MRFRLLGVALAAALLAPQTAHAIATIGKAGAVAPPKRMEKPKKKAHTAVAAKSITAGEMCKLKKRLSKPKLAAGGVYEIESVQKDAVILTGNGGTWRVKKTLIAASCVISPAPEKPAIAIHKVTAPPPEPASVPAPVAPAPLVASTATTPPVAAPASQPETETPPVAPPLAISPPPAPQEDAAARSAGWALTGIGAAGIAGGVVFFIVGDVQANALITRANAYNAAAVHAASEYNSINAGRSQVRTDDTLMWVCGGVGVAALATGIGLLAAHLTVAPAPGGASVAGTF